MSEDRQTLLPDNCDYWRGLSKEIQFICVLENGPAGVRMMGWEKGSSGRQAIRRLWRGDCEEQRAPREEKSERDGTGASSHLSASEERGHLSSQRPSLLCKMRIR